MHKMNLQKQNDKHFLVRIGNPVVYTDWVPGRKDPTPTFLHDEDCVRMDFGHDGQWEDVTCRQHHGYICEYAGKCTVYIGDRPHYTILHVL